MTTDQLTRAASEMEAALHRLDIQPGHTTQAQLEADEAAILPALVDGQDHTATRQNITASGAGKFAHNPTAHFENTPASSAGKFPERSPL